MKPRHASTLAVISYLGWVGPFKLRGYLDRVGDLDPLPPAASGVYVFSGHQWVEQPADLLYVGSGHKTKGSNGSDVLLRIGREVGDVLGFYRGEAYHGSGGYLLSEFCKSQRISPLDLCLAWYAVNGCPIPDEQQLYDNHHGKLSANLLNRERPKQRQACRSCECPIIIKNRTSSL